MKSEGEENILIKSWMSAHRHPEKLSISKSTRRWPSDRSHSVILRFSVLWCQKSSGTCTP